MFLWALQSFRALKMVLLQYRKLGTQWLSKCCYSITRPHFHHCERFESEIVSFGWSTNIILMKITKWEQIWSKFHNSGKLWVLWKPWCGNDFLRFQGFLDVVFDEEFENDVHRVLIFVSKLKKIKNWKKIFSKKPYHENR